MKLDLNDGRLRLTGLAGLMIYTAVVLKNGGEQMGQKKHPISSIVGPILFIIGWFSLAYSFVGKPSMKMNQKSLMAYGGAIGVIISVMGMKMLPLSQTQKKPLGLLFICSWISVAIACSIGKGTKSKQLCLFALANVLGSMLYILPLQRKNCVIDFVGMPMFFTTFISLAIANAL